MRCVHEIEVVGFMGIWLAMTLFVPIFTEVRSYFAGLWNACDLVVMWPEFATRKGRAGPPARIDRSPRLKRIDVKPLF